MAITQSAANLRPIAASVGIPLERSDQIKALSSAVTTEAGLAVVLRGLGYYYEKAKHLLQAGCTLA